MDTEDLINRAAQGDRAAVELLINSHRARLRRMVSVRMDPRLAARIDPSDVIQDAMIEAAQRLEDYLENRPLPFYPWLRKIAWECLVDLYHRHVTTKKRTVKLEQRFMMQLSGQSTADLGGIIACNDKNPSQQLIHKEMQYRINAALGQLNDKDREVLVMRHLEQLSVSEVAVVLDISEGAVKMRRLRAIQRLRDLLQGYLGPEAT